MRILLLGAEGQVGHELHSALAPVGDLSVTTERELDVCDFQALSERIRAVRPEVIVNATAYTDVDGAERDSKLAWRLNSEAVRVIAQEAIGAAAAVVHYSTDFVFDGMKSGAYLESDKPNPLNEYGRSKLAGEQALLESAAPGLVLRTAWVFSTRRKSFVTSILKLARERETLRVVSDQVGNPTFCRDLAQATALLLHGAREDPVRILGNCKGVYHVAGTGSCSRFEFAKAIIEADPGRQEHSLRTLEQVSSDAYPLPARRPSHAPLDCSWFTERFDIRMPAWQDALRRAFLG